MHTELFLQILTFQVVFKKESFMNVLQLLKSHNHRLLESWTHKISAKA